MATEPAPEAAVEPAEPADASAPGTSAAERPTAGPADDARYDYDLVVIGSGPGGQKAAIGAAKLGHRVAVVERRHMMGGVSVNTGTIPSKTLREAVLYLTGMAQRDMYGASYRVKSDITIEDLFARTQHVIGREIEVVRAQLLRNHVDILPGTGAFVDPHTVAVVDEDGVHRSQVSARFVVIATGSRPHRPDTVQFDDRSIVDSDGVLALERIPTTMVVVGAGIIGIEYASMFAALGTRVTIIDKRPNILEMCDPEVVESLKFHLRDLSVSFRLGEEVAGVDTNGRGTVTRLVSGKRIAADTVMYSAGRQGNTETLGLENAGLEADRRGRIVVDAEYRTSQPHVFAVGDVIGFPALAATSMDQGRLAALHAFGEPARELSAVQPIGIYTIPEISYCGRTEEELTADAVPYEVGISRYRELARGQIVGDSYGMLKLLVHTETFELLGVHIFGTGATDLVHIGQAIMACGGTVEYLVDTVLNYPTLSEAYKVAALDATNKIRQVARFVG
ncbi:Si-specific NAD(P)(+) transhydrogenase [Cellulomonas alba]|uniref:NAD(P)(+) transhydrogenase (Si-specific) n=1 Tax=Cellulomonas alba TaxID=3053467 RepID=A0ABT7SJR6_9CELL|nr:Si-specific NAD(P)(+) transhydrogenase [Cellulomonas alba]MDM7856432.1 Si-specific NAD(P)(+) transhydrogenase [Cellulomonas alba]